MKNAHSHKHIFKIKMLVIICVFKILCAKQFLQKSYNKLTPFDDSMYAQLAQINGIVDNMEDGLGNPFYI